MGLLQKILGWQKNKDEDTAFLEQVDAGTQALRDQLDRLSRAAADALSHHNRLEGDYDRCQRQAGEWEQRARQALADGDESGARQALTRQGECLEQVRLLEPELASSREATTGFTQQVAALRRKIAEAERNARALVARKNAAHAQRRIADAMAGLHSQDDAFGVIERYEEDVLQQEARARVLDDHLGDPATGQRPVSSDVDAQLEALRRDLNK